MAYVNKERKLAELSQIARKKEGKCLSTEYVDSISYLILQCKKGHQWSSRPDNLRRGSWCPECATENKRHKIQDMQKLAKERNGKCLSTQYINNKEKLLWECSEGHTFSSIPTNIMKGSWCPTCHIFYNEELCRTTFEQLFNETFHKQTPKWLKSPLGFPMHLDGYSKKLGIAFEYQGHHHFFQSYHNSFDEEELDKQKERDNHKKNLCIKNNVHLITITYKDDLKTLPNLLNEKFKQIGEDVSRIDFSKKIDFNKVYLHRNKLEIIQDIAKKRGGKCLSDKYLGIEEKLKFECSKGHIWETSARSVKLQKTWCPKCSGKEKMVIADIHKIAKERGGKSLSNKYINSKTKINWKCAEGHEWRATISSVKNGTWCPECAGVAKYSFENIKAMAKDRGGKCLSEKYEGAHNKLEWQCKNGHIWKTTPNSIRRGSWCPQCIKHAWVDSKRMSISQMQEIAKTKGGKCLSTNYINNQTKLEWECSKGHRWFAIAANIKNHGKWCPKCSGNARLSIEDMHQIAKDRGGKCLSEKYINSVTKINWRCSEGHEWSSVPSSIRSGTWCRKCSRKKLKLKRQNDHAK